MAGSGADQVRLAGAEVSGRGGGLFLNINLYFVLAFLLAMPLHVVCLLYVLFVGIS